MALGYKWHRIFKVPSKRNSNNKLMRNINIRQPLLSLPYLFVTLYSNGKNNSWTTNVDLPFLLIPSQLKLNLSGKIFSPFMAIFSPGFPCLVYGQDEHSCICRDDWESGIPAPCLVTSLQVPEEHKLAADRHREVEVWKFLQILLHSARSICQQSGETLQTQGLLLQSDSQELHRNFG